MMLVAMILGTILCFIFGVINFRYYNKLKSKGNLYVSIFDFIVVIFMIIILILHY